MDQYTMMDTLGRAYANNELEALRPLLADKCDYSSQYANESAEGAEEIITYMEAVHRSVDETCAYTYRVIDMDSILKNGVTVDAIDNQEGMHPCRYSLLLYQYGADHPVGVITAMLDLQGKFISIWVARDKNMFDVTFLGEELGPDSPKDLPSTVMPLIDHRKYVYGKADVAAIRKMRDKAEDTAEGVYIWRRADEYVKQWLPEQDYNVRESKIFADCIGYRCDRRGIDYTIFLYAYGHERTSQLDGAFCSKLAKKPFAQNSIILILYLKVDRYPVGSEILYRVKNYYGGAIRRPEFWRLKEVNGSYLLEYYPRKEMMDQTWQFMYAFNQEDTDTYDCIIADDNPSIGKRQIIRRIDKHEKIGSGMLYPTTYYFAGGAGNDKQ